MTSTASLVLLLLVHSAIAHLVHPPAKLPQVVMEGGNATSCPSVEMSKQSRNRTMEMIRSLLSDEVAPPTCPCGGPGLWHRIAHLDMSDPNQQCPPNWALVSTPGRACGRSRSLRQSCDSAVFKSNHFSYSHVCGRINAVQRGSPDAFFPSIDGRHATLEDAYVVGISLTHGVEGSRQHVWTFAAALYETSPNIYPPWICPCTNTGLTWPYQIPSFIGNRYFCDTGNPGPVWSLTALYPDDPLWDGEGCGPTSTCCQFNNPPWFCTTLPQPTTDDIELRICGHNGFDNEDVNVQLIDIYIL